MSKADLIVLGHFLYLFDLQMGMYNLGVNAAHFEVKAVALAWIWALE